MCRGNPAQCTTLQNMTTQDHPSVGTCEQLALATYHHPSLVAPCHPHSFLASLFKYLMFLMLGVQGFFEFEGFRLNVLQLKGKGFQS